MFTSGFDDLDKVLGKIVKESCSVETVYCDCEGGISTEQYVRPGEDKIMINWLEPRLRCTRPVDYTAEVKPHGTQNPQEFGLGMHIITYEFSYYGRTDKLTTRACFVDITVYACECPSVQTITATVEYGQPRAFVSWWEPEPDCPNTPSRGNPDRNHGWFTVGEHTMMYNYKHETYLQSFNIECHVNIIVTAA
ncbi:uncharacterized protein LOC114535266 [Dendronephthya gigantea]|nr:uncharacterized protein LOC114535266 [Dendronephthya gigantea]